MTLVPIAPNGRDGRGGYAVPWISVCIRIAGKAGILLALLSVAGCVTAPDRQTSPELSVLQVNEAFYKAIQDRDFIAMKGLWASSGPVAVVHPGWPQVLGRDAVLRSWKALLADKSAGMEDRMRELEAKVAEQEEELARLRSAPAQIERVEVPVVPVTTRDALAELAARAEALAAQVEEKVG